MLTEIRGRLQKISAKLIILKSTVAKKKYGITRTRPKPAFSAARLERQFKVDGKLKDRNTPQ